MTKSKKIPKEVTDHYNRMRNRLVNLEESGFAFFKIDPILENKNNQSKIIWKNQKMNEGINEKNFNKYDAYKKIIDNKSFEALLFDFSIIRCSMEFEGSKLVKQSFSWIPCPVDYEKLKIEEFSDIDSFSLYLDEAMKDCTNLCFRSTVRFDFDSNNNTEVHPISHVHFQHSNTRINSENPICFSSFLKYIIQNYYPESYFLKKNLECKEMFNKLKYQDWKGLNLKINSVKRIKYENKNSWILERLPQG